MVEGSISAGRLVVVGAGLAGCEAAWQAARRGIDVVLYEMRPGQRSPAHVGDGFAELVCSNSLRSDRFANAVGLLKEEMRRLDSLILAAADSTRVPAGRALAVDRDAFSARVTAEIEGHPRIQVRRERIDRIPDGDPVILATGPLTGSELAADLQALLGDEYLYFYDAIAPTVYADSIDSNGVFRASRWEDGPGDYLNVPLDRDQYETFVRDLVEADTVPLHAFEKKLYFEGCLPVEEIARRGPQTLAYGPLKPVGLVDPRSGRRPHAVVQLRQEDHEGVLYNLVGFQTKLRIGEQKRIFRSLPGLEKAVFARFGTVHRNTYVNAPLQLSEFLEVKKRPGLFLAGQMAGVEGYVESAALGLLAGLHTARRMRGLAPTSPDPRTAHAALMRHLSGGADARRFQPSNVTYGLFPALEDAPRKLAKREKNERLAERALAALESWTRASEARVA